VPSDYYDILGVTRTASSDEIKRAYRQLAHQHHPDKTGGNEEKFKEVNEAYQVLNDSQKRAHYDQFGQARGNQSGEYGGFGNQGFNVNFEDLGHMGDIFEQFFGGQRHSQARPTVRRGDDIQVDTSISFIESAHGVAKSMNTRLYQTCESCGGNGAQANTPIRACQTCRGSGHVTSNRQTMLGTFSEDVLCPDCHGVGKRPEKPCATCRGVGRQLRNKRLEFDIPAGIADGQQLRLSGQGEVPAYGGISGDIYINIHVTPHPQLRRDGNNIRSTATVSFAEAALGTARNVETINGQHELNIPAGIQPGTQLRLAEQGFRSLRGGRSGDHLISINIEIPKKLSKRQRQLLEEFQGIKRKRGLLF
jgi:molecular chaperone DnaJ